jgi:hypothetical protein
MAEAAFNKKTHFHKQIGLKLKKKKLVMCRIWSIASCGAETRTLRKVVQKHRGKFEMCCWKDGEDQLGPFV